MGGWAPFGYLVRDRKMVIDDAEAERVRWIFRRFVQLGSVTLLARELVAKNLTNRLDAGEAERILLAGAKRVRLARRTKAGPKHVSHRPLYMVLSEWAQTPAISDIGTVLAKQFGNDISDQSSFVGYRLYPWADRPDLLPKAA